MSRGTKSLGGAPSCVPAARRFHHHCLGTVVLIRHMNTRVFGRGWSWSQCGNKDFELARIPMRHMQLVWAQHHRAVH